MPIESLYSEKMAPWYDMYAHDERIRVHLKFIVQMFRKFGVRKFLDISCGTGNYIIPLTKLGFRGIGVDLEPAMIKQAKRKCKKARVKIPFYVQDMRELNIKGMCDAIIVPSSGFSYIKTRKESIQTLHKFRAHLKKNGILMLDTLYSETIPNTIKEVEKVSRGEVLYKVSHEYYTDKNGDFLFVKCIHKRFVNGKQLPVIKDDRFVKLRVYTPDKISQLLKQTGFVPLFFFGDYDKKKFSKSSPRLLTVARAV